MTAIQTEDTSTTPVRHFVYDALCVLALVIIGTRNHDTDTGVGGVLYVAAPFWIALVMGWLVTRAHRSSNATATGVLVWIITVALGMVLRNLVFDRGTAAAFIVVASVFLAITMNGWRIISTRND
jgi:FtsH-binding integral membrane protein